jgi:hypothetical protein
MKNDYITRKMIILTMYYEKCLLVVRSHEAPQTIGTSEQRECLR